jgi:hypothetical protein
MLTVPMNLSQVKPGVLLIILVGVLGCMKEVNGDSIYCSGHVGMSIKDAHTPQPIPLQASFRVCQDPLCNEQRLDGKRYCRNHINQLVNDMNHLIDDKDNLIGATVPIDPTPQVSSPGCSNVNCTKRALKGKTRCASHNTCTSLNCFKESLDGIEVCSDHFVAPLKKPSSNKEKKDIMDLTCEEQPPIHIVPLSPISRTKAYPSFHCHLCGQLTLYVDRWTSEHELCSICGEMCQSMYEALVAANSAKLEKGLPLIDPTKVDKRLEYMVSVARKEVDKEVDKLKLGKFKSESPKRVKVSASNEWVSREQKLEKDEFTVRQPVPVKKSASKQWCHCPSTHAPCPVHDAAPKPVVLWFPPHSEHFTSLNLLISLMLILESLKI